MADEFAEFLGSLDVAPDPITEVTYECGKWGCLERWTLKLLPGEKLIAECPACGNRTHQQVCG